MNGLTIDLRTTSDTPIYQQIAERIRAAILDGSLESDTCLPPIRTMAAELRVSVITVKKAYELLERQACSMRSRAEAALSRRSRRAIAAAAARSLPRNS